MCDAKPNNGAASAPSTASSGSGSEGMMAAFLLAIMMPAIGSDLIYLHHYYLTTDDDTNPPVTFVQCASLSMLAAIFTGLYIQHLLLRIKLTSMNMPVIYSGIPILGKAFQFLKETPWNLMLKWHEEYGDIYAFALAGRAFCSISKPSHLKTVLQSQVKVVKKDVGLTYHPFLVILGTGIVTSENKAWMKQRLKMSAALRIHVLDIIPRITLQAVQRLYEKLDKACENASTVELAASLRHLTLQVISKTFLSISADESDSTFAQLYLPIVDECNTRVWHPYRGWCFFLPRFWNHIWNVAALNKYVSNLITTRWQERLSLSGARKNDILDLVLDSHEKECGSTLSVSDVTQIRDEFKTFMLAGHETSAAMMVWALYELMDNSEQRKEVELEGQRIFGKTTDWASPQEDLPCREKLSDLVYAEASLKESLRKYSVVPTVIRRLTDELDLGGHVLPKGCRLSINIHAVHHNPKIWPNPMKFDSKRFLAGTKIQPYTFMPFIEGPRNCLGQHLALLESKMVLSLLLQRYNFQFSGGTIETDLEDKDKDPRHRYIVPVVPKNGVQVKVTRKF